MHGETSSHAFAATWLLVYRNLLKTNNFVLCFQVGTPFEKISISYEVVEMITLRNRQKISIDNLGKVEGGNMIKLEQENDKTCLYLEGEMTINNAEAFRDNLLLSLKQSNLVEIDFEAVTAVDLTCLQLICSAHRFAVESGKDVVIKDNSLPPLREARIRAGFDFQKSCGFNPSHECLWMGGMQQ